MTLNFHASFSIRSCVFLAMFVFSMVLKDSGVEALGPFNTLLNFRERQTRTPQTTTEHSVPTTSVKYTAVGGPSPTRPFKLIATPIPLPTPPFKVVAQAGSRSAFLRLQNLRGLMASSHGNRVRHYFQVHPEMVKTPLHVTGNFIYFNREMSKIYGKRSIMTDVPPWVKWAMSLKAQDRNTRSRESVASSGGTSAEEDARTIREIRALERASLGGDQSPKNHHVACFFNPVSCFGQKAFRARDSS